MRVLSLALLAASAIGAVSIGSASAMPFANPASAQESLVQDVRVVCDRYGRCYNRNAGRYYGNRYGYRNNGYGYRNIRELNELVTMDDPRIHWVGGSAR